MKLKLSDYKKGFKYQAWAGYEWWDVEVGKNGVDRKNFIRLCNEGGMSMIRVKIIYKNKK